MNQPALAADVEKIRAFNRFYTVHVGALEDHLLDSPFNLAQARVLYELGTDDGLTAAALARRLGLDPAYLSRMLRRFEQSGLVARRPDPADARGRILGLTKKGKAAHRDLVAASNRSIGAVAESLAPNRRRALVGAIETVQAILDPDHVPAPAPVVIRPHRMGDVSWIVHRHAVLYRDEYGWTDRFEALVAEIAADFMKSHDPAREQCWVAERDGAILGSVFLVQGDAADGSVAKLRLLYVEKDARGLGLGRRLTGECIEFARRAGYRRMTLWTNDCLTAARRLYDSLGFELVSEHPHSDFGPPMVGQVLERDL